MQIVIGVLVLVFFIILPSVTMMIYNKTFGERCEERRYESYRAYDFKGLEVEPCTIIANKGHNLRDLNIAEQDRRQKHFLLWYMDYVADTGIISIFVIILHPVALQFLLMMQQEMGRAKERKSADLHRAWQI